MYPMHCMQINAQTFFNNIEPSETVWTAMTVTNKPGELDHPDLNLIHLRHIIQNDEHNTCLDFFAQSLYE